MTNINKLVWGYIEQNVEIRKTLLNGLMNISALARKIAKEHHLQKNVDAIISAIRRYEGKPTKKKEYEQFYTLLKRAKISSKTKLSSILVNRNDQTERKVGSIYNKVDLKRDTTLRIFEVTNYIKIIIDAEYLKDVKAIFTSQEITDVEKGLGELTINYNNDITKVPGVFATLSNELAMNDVSIIDSMICHWEHIIVVQENDLERAFSVVFGLTKGK